MLVELIWDITIKWKDYCKYMFNLAPGVMLLTGRQIKQSINELISKSSDVIGWFECIRCKMTLPKGENKN